MKNNAYWNFVCQAFRSLNGRAGFKEVLKKIQKGIDSKKTVISDFYVTTGKG